MGKFMKFLIDSYRSGFLFLISFFVFISCGLDTFYYLDPPLADAEIANPEDPAERVFTFQTASNSSSSDIFKGTSVYYRLYNNFSTMTSNRSTIANINEEYSDAAMNRMLSLGFQPISVDDIELVSTKSEGVVNIEIRLFDENEYKAEVLVDGINKGEPLRMPLRKGFSFYPVEDWKENIYPLPTEEDEDTSYSNGGGDTWYVLAYAVSVGTSLELTPVYSQVTPLGYLAVTPDSQ